MQPRLENIPDKKLLGKRVRMTLAHNRTAELWSSLMPRRREIKNKLNDDLISMQIFDESFNFRNFNENTVFEKWAAVEVTDFDSIPQGLESAVLKGGLYAIFLHRGAAPAAEGTFRYIFGSWLPSSEYDLDDRPHFEVLGERYKNNQPDSEEEIWIPVRRK
jgi:AraC family transcriptional regulator